MAPISRDVFLLAMGSGITLAFLWFVSRMERRRDERTLRKNTNREG